MATKVRVAIVGAGVSGLALANSLIGDPNNRFEVQVFERDCSDFQEDRQGYLLSISEDGRQALQNTLDTESLCVLDRAWAAVSKRGAAVVDPKTMNVLCHLGDIKGYPIGRRISRESLRSVLRRTPDARGFIRYQCALDTFEVVPKRKKSDSKQNEHEILLHFQNPATNPDAAADILVAADGSHSRIHEILDLDNKFEIPKWTMIQSRGVIDEDTRATLPATFLAHDASSLFLGGKHLGGFANVFSMPHDTLASDERAVESDSKSSLFDHQQLYRIFYDFNIPRDIGGRIVEHSRGDKDEVVRLFCAYLVNELHYDPQGLPTIIQSAPQHVRTGNLTSSHTPLQRDWRKLQPPGFGRVILIGDAIHPMTPGRGMGANQALIDAATLAVLFRQEACAACPSFWSDDAMLALARKFDKDMFARAFKMVKASEQALDADITTPSGRAKLRAAVTLFETASSVSSVLNKIRGRKPEEQHWRHEQGKDLNEDGEADASGKPLLGDI